MGARLYLMQVWVGGRIASVWHLRPQQRRVWMFDDHFLNDLLGSLREPAQSFLATSGRQD